MSTKLGGPRRSLTGKKFARKKKDGYAGSDILMTQELLTLDLWDTDAISERQRELSTWAFDIWKLPDEAPPRMPHAKKTKTDVATAAQTDTTLDQLPEVPA